MLAVVLIALPSAAWAGTLDQQQTNVAGGATDIIGPDGPQATPLSPGQTFTAGLSGFLDQVDLYLDDGGGAPFTTGPVTVEIRNVSGGLPGGAVLASASVPESAVPSTPAFVAVLFASPPPVTAGSQYAIVAYVDGRDLYGWWRADTDAYTGGGLCFSRATPPGSWNCESTTDLAFRTYVDTDTDADGGGGGGGIAEPPEAPAGPPASRGCKDEQPTLLGTSESDRLVGTPGPDVIKGLGGADVIVGLSGDDLICGGEGEDTTYAGPGLDTNRGGRGADLIFGGKSNDFLHGYLGDDRVGGGRGIDRCRGGKGADIREGCESQ